MALCVLCRFLKVSWVGFQTVIVAFPDHTHFLVSEAKAFLLVSSALGWSAVINCAISWSCSFTILNQSDKRIICV